MALAEELAACVLNYLADFHRESVRLSWPGHVMVQCARPSVHVFDLGSRLRASNAGAPGQLQAAAVASVVQLALRTIIQLHLGDMGQRTSRLPSHVVFLLPLDAAWTPAARLLVECLQSLAERPGPLAPLLHNPVVTVCLLDGVVHEQRTPVFYSNRVFQRPRFTIMLPPEPPLRLVAYLTAISGAGPHTYAFVDLSFMPLTAVMDVLLAALFVVERTPSASTPTLPLALLVDGTPCVIDVARLHRQLSDMAHTSTQGEFVHGALYLAITYHGVRYLQQSMPGGSTIAWSDVMEAVVVEATAHRNIFGYTAVAGVPNLRGVHVDLAHLYRLLLRVANRATMAAAASVAPYDIFAVATQCYVRCVVLQLGSALPSVTQEALRDALLSKDDVAAILRDGYHQATMATST